MKKLPLEIGVLHFVGIGGIGMSGIAEVLDHLGYSVQGSDLSDSANVARLRKSGIKINIGHKASNIKAKDGCFVGAVVVSSAVKEDNPEIVEARKNNIPIIRRAEMLAELMRFKSAVAVAGTHGKTTTTSLIGHLLDVADFDPTIINGGIINRYGTNTRMGNGDWMIVEADESDGTFTQLPAIAAVITNIDPEHLDHYGTFDVLKDAFKRFVTNLPFYGFVAACIDDPDVVEIIPDLSRRVISYGFCAEAEFRAQNLRTSKEGMVFDVFIQSKELLIENIILPMHGKHNVLNSLASMVVASELGVSYDQVKQGLESFSGVKRRFTKTGEVNGVTIIDDYAHHPVEISSVLNAARGALSDGDKLIAVMQPHRYSRLSDLFDEFSACFSDADDVIIAPVFEAGEEPIKGIDSTHLAQAIVKSGHAEDKVHILKNEKDLAEMICNISNSGDMVVCLGAGSITYWANSLPAEMTEIYQGREKNIA